MAEPSSDNVTRQPLLQRLWIYQKERFPLFKTGVLLVAFSAASINVSAILGDRPLPALWTYVAAWFVVFVIFFQMRAADEWKDLETDSKYRPERPVPRGLVSLKLILLLAAALVPMALFAAVSVTPVLGLLLLLVWLWLGVMTFEFFAPRWLKARPLIYLGSHMLIMPLIDLFLTGAEWLKAGGSPPAGLWLFLVLSFVNGCVIEIGRKLYAPQNERQGVETYTAQWGVPTATLAWTGCLAIAAGCLIILGFMLGAPVTVGACSIIALGVAAFAAWRFCSDPSPVMQSRIDGLAGTWVLVCYLAAGFLPLISRGLG